MEEHSGKENTPLPMAVKVITPRQDQQMNGASTNVESLKSPSVKASQLSIFT